MSGLQIAVTAQDHALGSANAKVTLVEYADYQCPYCGQAYQVIKYLLARFGDDLRFVFRNFPLQQLHAEALPAALFAEYAAQEGRFWEVHDALFENQQQLGEGLYVELLQANGLPATGLRSAFESPALLQRIQQDLDGGISSGVKGTPSFFLNGEKFELRSSYDELEQAIAALIN